MEVRISLSLSPGLKFTLVYTGRDVSPFLPSPVMVGTVTQVGMLTQLLVGTVTQLLVGTVT